MPAPAADWDVFRIPVTSDPGTVWRLHSVSDDFSYTAAPTGKPSDFTDRWKGSFVNSWMGPGLTEWNRLYKAEEPDSEMADPISADSE